MLLARDHPQQALAAAYAADRVLSVSLSFAIVGAVAQWAVGFVNGVLITPRSSYLDPDAEYTVFAWPSGVATFSAALAARLIAISSRAGRVQWLVLATFIAFYSADDCSSSTSR